MKNFNNLRKENKTSYKYKLTVDDVKMFNKINEKDLEFFKVLKTHAL